MTPGTTAPPVPDNSANGPKEHPFAALHQRLQTDLTARLADRSRADADAGRTAMTAQERRAYVRRTITELFDTYADEALAAGGAPVNQAVEQQIGRAVEAALFELGGFQRYLDDPEIENINANGCDVVWVRYADGHRERVAAVARSDEDLVALIRDVAARSGVEERRFDRGSPVLSVQLVDGSRMFAVMAVTARPSVSIRRHRFLRVTPEDLVGTGTLDTGLRELFRAVVLARKNLLICGGTAVGKTTLLRALASDIPPWERLVTVEDSFELGLDRDVDAHPDVVAMQAREMNIEREGEISLAYLVRSALRMSPDRVIVGEVRGDELVPMLNAMSQGNDGSMATLHASSSRGAFTRLAAYAAQGSERLPLEATNLLVASAIDFVVHLGYDPAGRRVVTSVREVVDAEGAQVVSNEVYRPGSDGRALPGVPLRTATLEQFVATGFDPAWWDRPDGWWDT